MIEIRSIKAEAEARGHRHEAEVLLLREERAAALEAGLLGLKTRRAVFHSLVLHRENGRPIQLEERFVNPLLAPRFLEQDFSSVTADDYLGSLGLAEDSDHTILAQQPSERQRQLLEMRDGIPCLLLRRRSWSLDGVITWVQLWHPGDRYRLGSEFRGPGSGFNTA